MSYASVGFLESVAETITGAATAAREGTERVAEKAGALDGGGDCNTNQDCERAFSTYCCTYHIRRSGKLFVERTCVDDAKSCEAINALLECNVRGGQLIEGDCWDDKGDLIPGVPRQDPAALPEPATVSSPAVSQAIQSAKTGQPSEPSQSGAGVDDTTIMYIVGAAAAVGLLAFLYGRAS